MPTDLEAAGADYRHAKLAVVSHRVAEAAADQALKSWRRARRGVPSHELYDRATGEPLDPEHVELEAASAKASADVLWCKALVIACGEVVKGVTFAEAARRRSAAPAARPDLPDLPPRPDAPEPSEH